MNNQTNIFLQIAISKLLNRLRNLNEQMAWWKKKKELEKELNVCKAYASNLEEHIERNNINAMQYFFELNEIANLINQIEEKIENKDKNWVNTIIRTISNVIKKIFNIAIQALLPPPNQK